MIPASSATSGAPRAASQPPPPTDAPAARGCEDLQPGQRVTIPAATPGYEASHVAMPGDSWASVAQRWRVPEQALREANPGDEPAADDDASEEGVASFLDGAVAGDFSDNQSWSAIGGQIVVGVIPIVGQVADARDTVANIKKVWNGEEGGWVGLGASVVGWVPLVGDAAKAAIRGGSKAADAGVEVGQRALRHGGDEAAATGANGARRLPGETPADAAQRLDRDIAHARAHDSSPDEISQLERRRAENLADARKEAAQLDGAVPGRLLPSSRYDLNGYQYTTDAQGRIKIVEGELRLDAAPRNSSAQSSVGSGDGRLSVDQGGHLIGAQFGGYRGVENLTPMNKSINDYHSGDWGMMEKRWATALSEGTSVSVEIELVYTDDSMRAVAFKVTETIGDKVKAKIIDNPIRLP